MIRNHQWFASQAKNLQLAEQCLVVQGWLVDEVRTIFMPHWSNHCMIIIQMYIYILIYRCIQMLYIHMHKYIMNGYDSTNRYPYDSCYQFSLRSFQPILSDGEDPQICSNAIHFHQNLPQNHGAVQLNDSTWPSWTILNDMYDIYIYIWSYIYIYPLYYMTIFNIKLSFDPFFPMPYTWSPTLRCGPSWFDRKWWGISAKIWSMFRECLEFRGLCDLFIYIYIGVYIYIYIYIHDMQI